jgi:hypothetical protein
VRWAALQDQDAVAALKAECKAATVEVRPVPYNAWDHLPKPYSHEISGAASEPRRVEHDAELGLDSQGRATFLRYPVPGRFQLVFSWTQDSCEVVSPGVTNTAVTHFNYQGGRLVEEIEVNGTRRLDGQPAVGVTRWIYDGDGRPELAVETYESGAHASFGGAERGPHWRGKLYRLSYDEAGTLSQIRWAHSRAGVADGHDVDLAQAAALAGESTLFDGFRPLYESAAVRADRRREEAEALRIEALNEGEPPSPEALIRDHAMAGFRLVTPQQASQKPAAILGGPGLLPAGVEWPTSDQGRALGFLAAIDFSALPPTPDDAPDLPDAGWLLCFADIDDPTGYDPSRWNEPQPEPAGWQEGQWYGEPTPNVPGAGARVLWVPPGSEPIAVVGPGLRGEYPTREHRRVAEPQRTLPDGYGAGQAIGLSTNHAEVYADLARELRYGSSALELPDDHVWVPDDWVLGAVTGVQGASADDDSLLLLHLASVEFQDGGAIQVRIPAGALAAQDWTQAYMVADSG